MMMVTVLFTINGYSYSKSINAKSVFPAQTHLKKKDLNTLKQRTTYRLINSFSILHLFFMPVDAWKVCQIEFWFNLAQI